MLIPRAVYNEVIGADKDKSGSHEVSDAMTHGEIDVRDIANTRLSDSLKNSIHPGEAEVITLALEVDNPLLLLDDQNARQIAARFNLKYTGLLGILMKARVDNKIPSLRDEIENLRTVMRFWISDMIMDKALTIVGEKSRMLYGYCFSWFKTIWFHLRDLHSFPEIIYTILPFSISSPNISIFFTKSLNYNLLVFLIFSVVSKYRVTLNPV